MLPGYHVWRVHQKQPPLDIEADHFFRLGLREPLAPIKPLAARSGAIVKAAMQPPPDNKERLVDGGWGKNIWGGILGVWLNGVGCVGVEGWGWGWGGLVKTPLVVGIWLVTPGKFGGGECSWIIEIYGVQLHFGELMILHHLYDPAFLEGSALTRKVMFFFATPWIRWLLSWVVATSNILYFHPFKLGDDVNIWLFFRWVVMTHHLVKGCLTTQKIGVAYSSFWISWRLRAKKKLSGANRKLTSGSGSNRPLSFQLHQSCY